MNDTALLTIAITGFTVAFLHAAIPTHWVPFVLVGKARGWSRRRTLAVTAVAGSGHILVTTLIGFLIAWGGFEVEESLEHIFPFVTSGILLLVGLYFAVRQWRGQGICHHHPPGSHHQPSQDCGHDHDHGKTHWDAELAGTPLVKDNQGDWAAIGGLFSMVTLSPCEGFLPIYLSGVQFGWSGFVVLSAILAVATTAGMTLLTGITLLGSERFRLERFERYEAGLLAGLFLVLAAVTFFLRHGH
jgi:ABC-type nickel/cobalt efflux system permease component RcnA